MSAARCNCGKGFATEEALAQHRNDTGHIVLHPCPDCNRVFRSARGLQDHHKDKNHDRHRCEECDKTFQKEAHLIQHMASIVHHPLGVFECGCGDDFPCPSARLQHIESGGCSSKESQKMLSQIVDRSGRKKRKPTKSGGQDWISRMAGVSIADADSDSDSGVATPSSTSWGC